MSIAKSRQYEKQTPELELSAYRGSSSPGLGVAGQVFSENSPYWLECLVLFRNSSNRLPKKIRKKSTITIRHFHLSAHPILSKISKSTTDKSIWHFKEKEIRPLVRIGLTTFGGRHTESV